MLLRDKWTRGDRKAAIILKDHPIKRLGWLVCALLVFAPVVLAQSDSALIGRAEALLKDLQDGRYAEIVKDFNPAMVKAIPEERLRAVELILAFERERVVQRMVFDTDGKIAGLAYNPANMAALPPAM